jgi:hypothetical protein
MTTATVKGEEFMTDFQFKALMMMVLEIAEKSKDLEEVKNALRRLAKGKFPDDSEE